MRETITEQQFTVLDLFCGAGGLSLGFAKAGFSIIRAVDNNDAALETYNANFHSHAVKLDLSNGVDLPTASVIIGGPPCQGFSSAGLRKVNDHRNSLVSNFAEIICRLRPAAFIFENVEGFLTAEDGTRVLELLTPLIGAGYRIHLRKVNAANYGVPQHRKRVIAIGGLGWNPTFPEPTHAAFGAPGAHLATQHSAPTPTVYEAINNLPPATIEPPGIPQGHYSRPLEGVDLLRAAALKPGQMMRDLPEELQHESYRKRAFRRVIDGTPSERRGGAPAGLRRLRSDEPSKAITGGARSEFIHPTENRPLTIRECARLQTFPDEFTFCGNASEQAQLIGNAVPPLFALAIANNLANDLATAEQVTGEGALLSFVPTLSSGYSPVLRKVTGMILEKFAHTPRSIPRSANYMTLTKTQLALITKVRAAGASELGVSLDDGICAYLVAVIIKDLGLSEHFPELPTEIPPFFSKQPLSELRLDGIGFLKLLEKLVSLLQDADTYFYCLATVHKARLKYERILKAQAIPTIDQVGPRGLLQFGSLSPKALAGFLFWRKWIFDIDNRAGQETGYVFEPIIAHAIGGVAFGAKNSPVTRGGAGKQGRQVDCIRETRAYELKLRVTIAASGQGRWGEELEFPNDCKASGYTPVLVVLDPTPNPKLKELRKAFLKADGEVYIGQDAWDHLKAAAGTTMARFLELYVHVPIQSLLKEAPEQLPEITFKMDDEQLTVTVGAEALTVRRAAVTIDTAAQEELPDDVDEHIPGP